MSHTNLMPRPAAMSFRSSWSPGPRARLCARSVGVAAARASNCSAADFSVRWTVRAWWLPSLAAFPGSRRGPSLPPASGRSARILAVARSPSLLTPHFLRRRCLVALSSWPPPLPVHGPEHAPDGFLDQPARKPGARRLPAMDEIRHLSKERPVIVLERTPHHAPFGVRAWPRRTGVGAPAAGAS